jgi:O-antigen/teichoic acid export membrane protein
VSEDSALADGQHLARGAVANAVVLLAANFRGIFTFLIARLLGAAAFGRFGVVFLTTDLLSKAGVLGFDSSIVPLVATRAATGNGDACRLVFRRAILLAATASVLIAVLGLMVVSWATRATGLAASGAFFRNFDGGEAIMLLALPGIAVARISTGAARGLLSMRNEFYSRGLTETWVTIGVFVIAVAFGVRDRAPAIAVVAGTSAAALVAFVLARQTLSRVPVAASPDRVPVPAALRHRAALSTPALLRYSLPTAGSGLLNVLVTEADVLLLAAYVGRAPGVTPETFGVFAIAAQVAVGLRKVRQIFDPIFAPVVATRSVSEHRGRLKETVAGPGRWVLSAQLPLVGALVLSGGSIMRIYGSEYRQGALWLALLGVAHGANTFAGLVETLLMIERPDLNLINAIVTVGVQLAAGVILIPRFGVTGAALAMCLGFTVQGVLRFAELRHVFGWSWPWRSLRRPIAAFAIAFLPAAALRLSGGPLIEIVSGLLFLLFYAGAWRLLGADPADREIWRTLVASRRAKSQA